MGNVVLIEETEERHEREDEKVYKLGEGRMGNTSWGISEKRNKEHVPFLDPGFKATLHTRDVILQPGMFCSDDVSAIIPVYDDRLQHLMAQVPQPQYIDSRLAITDSKPAYRTEIGRKLSLPSTLQSSVSS